MASAAGTTTARALRVFPCVCVIFSLAGCGRVWQSLYLSGCDRDIKKATKSIEMAKSDAQRAVAYADRGDAYAEKTRYSRAFKLISTEEYERLFGLALTDYRQAATLDPDNGELYFRRGRTYYFRAALDLMQGMKSSDFFIPAKADFSKAIEKNPRHELAFDMQGLANDATGDLDASISDFAQEAALNPKSRYRLAGLADAYCRRRSSYLREKKYDPAIADLEKAVDIESSTDPCECEPYNPLVAIYVDKQDYAKARTVADRAKKAGKTIAPEYREKLNGR
jgi:tetratricopeptide (TPR) repeat protein